MSNNLLPRALPTDGSLGTNFDFSQSGNIRTFTLNTDFGTNGTWTRKDITYSNNTVQVIIDGNNHIVEIDEDENFDGLFFAGNYNEGNNKPTIIKNFIIKGYQNINIGLAKITGSVKFENCHLELFGNINNQGCGLAGNYDGDNQNTKLELINCSVKMFGRVGNNGGPLIGYIAFNSDSIYTIDKCYTIVTDNDSIPTPEQPYSTLNQSAGAFVGSGISNIVTITNSFCIFNGSIGYGAGIISGKYVGSNGTLTINNFYAVTNISYINLSDGSVANSSYLLCSYHGGSPFTSFNIGNINILNIGINLQKVYGYGSTVYTNVALFNKHTTYSSFANEANTTGNKIGNNQYNITFGGSDKIFYIFNTNPIYDYNINLADNILKITSKLSSFTIEDQQLSNPPFTPTLPTILLGDGTISYSSNDTSNATVDSSTGEITLISNGNVTIRATVSGNDYYYEGIKDATFRISSIPILYTAFLQKIKYESVKKIEFSRVPYQTPLYRNIYFEYYSGN